MIRLRPKHLKAAYELCRCLPPFSHWGLPEAHEIEFRVNSRRDEYGRYMWDGGHRIEISRHNVKHLHSLVVTMAHEVIHLRQRITKTDNRYQHNREFMRLAKRVCLSLGFDSKGFA